MRSRAARLTFGAVAWIAIGTAAFLLIQSEKQISRHRQGLRAFDLHAREATDALADLRAAQQAYVAAGQGVMFWMPKVSSLIQLAARAADELRASAVSDAARQSLLEAGATITEFGNVDRRARDYLKSGQQLMAGDVVFTEGGETAAQAARHIETARLAEHQAFDASEALQRRQQAYAAGGAAALSVLVLLALACASPGRAPEAAMPEAPLGDRSVAAGDLPLRDGRFQPASSDSPAHLPRQSVPALKAAAELCTEFGRVADLNDLRRLLARAADALDASGVIIWIGSSAGADLRPVLAHGYSSTALARMPPIPRSADNAAAAAYRTSALQIVLAQPGASNGAVVAPLLASDGCIGALTAEINNRGETSDAVQALAAIFAAQLAGLLASSAAPGADGAAGSGVGQIAI